MSHLRTEFMPAGSNLPVPLSSFYRGNVSGFVRKNAVGNSAVNRCASIPESGIIKLSNFRGKAAGWDFTNAGTITNYSMSTPFGTDWVVDWPKTLINNGTLGATSTAAYALQILGPTAGRIELINHGQIRGAGGLPNGGAGQHALRVNCNVPFYFANDGTVYGGGGAGGNGGVGGNGGSGTSSAWVYEGYPGVFNFGNYVWSETVGGSTGTILWAGVNKFGTGGVPRSVSSIAHSDGYTYFEGAVNTVSGGNVYYYIYRGVYVTTIPAVGIGGAGGAGGRGQGYDGANSGGLGGAGGTAGGTNAGAGGTGGTGGAGGLYGVAGGAGTAGSTGASGIAGAGSAGAAGTVGGAAGYSVYVDTEWHKLTPWVAGNFKGTIGPTAAT
jgi:hypothetical protein